MQVCVIGGGVIGCAVAYELARRGADVQVFEMRDVGRGATYASAGVLAPYIEGHAHSLLALGVRSLAIYDDLVARARADSGIDVGYERQGTLQVALTDEEAAGLRGAAGRLHAGQVEHRLIDGAETRELEPALGDAAAALLIPTHGYVAAGALTSALAVAAQRRGVQFVTNRAVESVSTSGGRLRVEAGGALHETDAIVVAAGSWSGRIATGGLPVPVKPVRGQLLRLRLPCRAAGRVLWGTNCYMVPWQDGTVLVGATVEDVGFDEGATVAGVRDLLEAACDLLPLAWGASFEEVRVGLRPATEDELPVIGESSTMPGVYYATGHYRNGVLLAPLTAALVADLVLERQAGPELAFTSPARLGL